MPRFHFKRTTTNRRSSSSPDSRTHGLRAGPLEAAWPEDVAALAIHLMLNTAVTGATYDIDGGQQLVS